MELEDLKNYLPIREDGVEIDHQLFSGLSEFLWANGIPISFTLDCIKKSPNWIGYLSGLCRESPVIFFYDYTYYLRTQKGSEHATLIKEFKANHIVGDDPIDVPPLGNNTNYKYKQFIDSWVSLGCKIVKTRRHPDEVLGLEGKKKKETLGIDARKQLTIEESV